MWCLWNRICLDCSCHLCMLLTIDNTIISSIHYILKYSTEQYYLDINYSWLLLSISHHHHYCLVLFFSSSCRPYWYWVLIQFFVVYVDHNTHFVSIILLHSIDSTDNSVVTFTLTITVSFNLLIYWSKSDLVCNLWLIPPVFASIPSTTTLLLLLSHKDKDNNRHHIRIIETTYSNQWSDRYIINHSHNILYSSYCHTIVVLYWIGSKVLLSQLFVLCLLLRHTV